MNENNMNFFNISQQFKDYQKFKEQAKQNISNQNITNKFDGLKSMYQTSQTATDTQTKQKSDTIVRLWEVAMKGREYAQKQWKDWSAANDERVINTLSDSLPNFKANLDNYMMDTGMDATGFAINMWWQQPEMEEENSSLWAWLLTAWAYWLWAATLLWGWVELVDRVLKPYNWSFDMSEKEAWSIQNDNVNKGKIKDYDRLIKQQEKVLDKAIKDNIWVEEAQAKLDYLKSSKEKVANELKVMTRKTVDTAADYNLRWLSKAGIWDEAKRKWEMMFETEILPALQNSKQTINIQELIDSIDIEELAKNDEDKLRAYADALEDLKNSYSDPKYAEYSMMDAQTLKSWLQGRTPQKFYKKKWLQAEITNELQELKWVLGSKIKNELHNKLSTEMWVDTATKYLDYANLMDIAKQWVKDRAASKSKQGFWNFQNFIKDKLSWVTSWPWLAIRKVRNFIDSIPSRISEAWKNILKEIEKNPKALLKKWLKWVKELLKMDAFMFAPDTREMANDVQYEVSLDLIKQRLNWKWVFKWKSEEEIEELLPMQTIMDTLQDEEFMQYLYNQWIDIEDIEKQLTNMSE